MADVTVKRLDEFEAIFGGGFRRVRAGLGVTSFGLAVMDLPPDFNQYPEHDHGHDGQEEVYTVLAGKATLTVGGEDHELEPGVFARVGPQESRKIMHRRRGRPACWRSGPRPGRSTSRPSSPRRASRTRCSALAGLVAASGTGPRPPGAASPRRRARRRR